MIKFIKDTIYDQKVFQIQETREELDKIIEIKTIDELDEYIYDVENLLHTNKKMFD